MCDRSRGGSTCSRAVRVQVIAIADRTSLSYIKQSVYRSQKSIGEAIMVALRLPWKWAVGLPLNFIIISWMYASHLVLHDSLYVYFSVAVLRSLTFQVARNRAQKASDRISNTSYFQQSECHLLRHAILFPQ